jgi:hypothetical protein
MGSQVDLLYARLFSRAADLVGGSAQLCRRLDVTEDECARWMKGAALPPRDVLLRVIDILIEHVSGSLPPPRKGGGGVDS